MTRIAPETISIFQNDQLSHSSSKVYSSVFPMTKESWYKLRLILKLVTTIGTGTGAKFLAEYQYLKNIILRTSDGEIICSTPAIGLYYFNFLMYGAGPNRTAFAAADGNYYAIVDIPFTLPFLARLEDTCLDSGRYSSIELEVQTGALTDLLTTVGTASVVPYLSAFIERSKSGYYDSGKPFGGYPVFKTLAPVSNTQGYIPFESSQDLVYFGFFIHGADSPTLGLAYSGNPSDAIIDGITFGDSMIKFISNAGLYWFKELRNKMANSDLTGILPYHFINQGSIFEAYRSGNVGEIRFEWLSSISGQLTPFVYGFRKFKRS